VGEDAEHVEGVGVMGICREDLAVETLGFGKIAGFVVAEGLGEEVG
jgi:hypothetical protein